MGVFVFFGTIALWDTLRADSRDWILRRFEPPDGVNFEEVRDIEFGDQESIWFSSWGNGIARLRESDWMSFSKEDGHLPSNFVPSLSWDAANRVMWAGTDEGLVALLESRSFVVDLPANLTGEGFEITLVQWFDTGELWIGSRLGEVLAGRPVVDQGIPRLVDVREVIPTTGDHGSSLEGS